ncbi:1-phosphatidylinositol 4,5-bisphosphate phosphodiesterase 1 [Leucoagaricus sp. SymC.cos]|nr:1-phosphatidylinositol 4,5-bisphosphate phosphodiesterase 1 [Leucoagaricus sp. SymC.cos]
MLKISNKSQKRVVFKLDPDGGQITYKSRKGGIVPIEAIKEIRTGENTKYDRLRFDKPEDWTVRWLTVIYIIDGSYKTLHMIADTHDVLKLWEVSLRKLHAIRQGLMTGLGNLDLRQTIWERQYWRGADQQGDQKLEFHEVVGLCKRLNVRLPSHQLQKLFRDADTQKLGYLDFQCFQRFVRTLKYRPELKTLYDQVIKSESGKFDYPTFRHFIRDIQKSSATEDELKSIFVKYTHAPSLSNDLVMSLDQFSSFLLSPDNAVFYDNQGIWQDMNRPLSDYYVSSSHNTYLVGHQLVGVSTIEGYIRALLHSCRSVELDIYDGDEEPMIYHGKTFTSKVSLRDICKAIMKYAFITSPYPLVISAEVHCGLRQQDMIVDIMKEVFGEKLIQAPVENRPKLDKLPSPEELKCKILFKARSPLPSLSSRHIPSYSILILLHLERASARKEHEHGLMSRLTLISSSESSTPSSSEDENGGFRHGIKSKWRKFRGKEAHSPAGTSPPNPSARATPVVTLTPTNTSTPSSGDDNKLKMSLRIVTLLVYTVGVKCHGIGTQADVSYEPEHMFSLSENSANRLMKAKGVLGELIEHTQTNLVRIYPKGMRVNSTNYEPHKYWAAGAQVVAINWQTFDLGYTINQAMFQRNGRSGYVLKPLALRLEGKRLLSKRSDHFFDITIISAQQLPRLRDSSGQEVIEDSIVDPYVEVNLHIPDWTTSPFLPSSSKSSEYQSATDANTAAPTRKTSAARRVSYKTKVIKNNGFNPTWQENLSIPFDCVGGPDGGMLNLIFVEVAVRQEGEGGEKEPIAIYCAPLGTVEPGYRHLPLYDMQLTQHMFSTLFVRSGIRNAG